MDGCLESDVNLYGLKPFKYFEHAASHSQVASNFFTHVYQYRAIIPLFLGIFIQNIKLTLKLICKIIQWRQGTFWLSIWAHQAAGQF